MEHDQYLDNFLLHYFDGIHLKKPLFYSASFAIRFEMGGDIDTPKERVEQVKQRAIALFDRLTEHDNDICFVIFVDKWSDESINDIESDVFKVFNTYINKFDFGHVFKQEKEYRYRDSDETDDIVTMRYYINVKSQDLKVDSLIEAIANRTLGLEPSIDGDIYLINDTHKTIFHLYDDRGLDIVAENKETLRTVYQQYSHWILDYDRNKINELFS
ncbi:MULTISPECIES: DUF3885 domain-containing protein [Paenibacillus]|uniref:DUF3885 domain-containing protein n=1 Tax=Paenibacillus alvei TaxID=44250 RepID=A0ABT4E352_PAEAL|nr:MULTISPECIES: DUF3885 domain-containing protein [Paenibacillus]EPY14900.1 hypothetical protein PAAL66ix_00235 [Paenibacillus alvei A6-6i-x]MCY9528154.1 DUF3885 domain-containing protein [Paenibacillus alvei]SDF47628.1 protein of unknown function [Paenibacillus sp. cl6col]